MNWVAYLGYAVVTLSYLPQLVKMFATRSVDDLSPLTLWVLFIGLCVVEIYAISLEQVGYILGHSCSVVLSALWLVGYYKFRRKV